MGLGTWLRERFSDVAARNARANQLRTECAANWPVEGDSPAPAAVAAVIDDSGGSPPTWETLVSAEVELTRSMPFESLKIRHANLRDDFIALAGSDNAAAYIGRMTDSKSCTEERLRAEALDLVNHVQRLRRVRHGFNFIRTAITLMATLLAVLFCVLIVLYFLAATREQQSWTPFASTMLIFAGMLGGCLSALSRLYTISWTNELASGVENFTHMFWNIGLNFVLSVLEGGIFAVLLYLAFMGNFVSGSLFPAFEDPKSSAFFHEFFERGLVTHGDYAKALLWGFLAGFSERLVPDFLNTVGSQLKGPGSA